MQIHDIAAARITAVVALLATAACGNLTAGGATGEARVLLSGDAAMVSTVGAVTASTLQWPANELVPFAAVAHGGGPMLADSTEAEDDPEGEVEVEFRMYLVAASGALVELTEGEARVRVDLEGVREPEVASQVIEAATYSTLRIVFTEISAEVDAGLIINGIPVTGEIRVEIEDLSITVDRSLALNLGADEMVELLVDLNAASWLQAVDPVTGTVDAQVVADLVAVTVR